ncbi:MAG TPA: 2OG-Fe(II) oxygenase [Acidimicrobiia bacterium]|nr:2OG-Fe(II) oxygenase [Acidimicrobiia bacterium]
MSVTSQDPGVTISPLGVFDDPRYSALAQRFAPTYRSAEPFPHAVIDDFLPDDLAHAIARAFPARDDLTWVERDNVNNRRRFVTDETKLEPFLREVLREFNSRQFLLFVETLTGIDNLIPDPYFIGGGIHISERGDFLNIHADFNWHHKLQAHRRCNALLYLNEEWHPEWGGYTEMWNRDMTEKVDEVEPGFNRLLVFSTGEHSNHGAPVPNACPEGVLRKVLNFYYYTTHRDDEDAAAVPHFTLYKTEASPTSVELGTDYRAAGAAYEGSETR